ncbi:hypothetical protein ACA910_004301 [Epithemia clementina (nom. ined.)]
MTIKDPVEPYNPYAKASAPPGEEDITIPATTTETDIIVAPPGAETDPEIPIASAIAVGPAPAPPTTTTTTTTIVPAVPVPTTTTASLVSGYKVQLVPSIAPGREYRVTIKPNLWLNTTPETIPATDTDSGEPFPIRLQSQVHSGCQTKVVVIDATTSQPCAVLRKNDPQNPDKFHIFGFVPYVPDQKPSITMKHDDGRPLYTWGSLTNADSLISYSNKRSFDLRMQNGWQYMAQRDGGKGSGFVRGFFGGGNNNNSNGKPKQFSVTVATHSTTVGQRNVHTQVGKGSSYATLQETPGRDWNLHVQAHSEHDPGLMVALTLLLDELHRSRM